MAIVTTARDVKFFDLVVERRAKFATYPALREIAEIWVEAHANGSTPPKEFERGNTTALINDISVDDNQNTITILLEIAEKSAPDPTLRDHTIRTRRQISKTLGEGNSFSAHIVISTTVSAQHANTYLCLVELMPTISTWRIRSVLNHLIRRACNEAPLGRFTYRMPGGTNKEVPFVPSVSLDGHPSDQLVKDIETGRINGLHLISRTTQAPLGQSSYLTPDEGYLKIKVSKKIPVGQRISEFVNTLSGAVKDYPVTRVFLQPEHGGRSFHTDIDTATGSPLNEAYIKSKRISPINPPLVSSSPEKIVRHFEDAMKHILISER